MCRHFGVEDGKNQSLCFGLIQLKLAHSKNTQFTQIMRKFKGGYPGLLCFTWNTCAYSLRVFRVKFCILHKGSIPNFSLHRQAFENEAVEVVCTLLILNNYGIIIIELMTLCLVQPSRSILLLREL